MKRSPKPIAPKVAVDSALAVEAVVVVEAATTTRGTRDNRESRAGRRKIPILRPSGQIFSRERRARNGTPRLILSRRGAEVFVACFCAIQPYLAEFPDQSAGPAVNIVLAHQLAHALHTNLFFLGTHFERSSNRFCRLVDIVGIDLQRIP